MLRKERARANMIAEMFPAVFTIIAEILFTVVVLAQSGGIVFYRVTQKSGDHTYFHTEHMDISVILIRGIAGLVMITLFLALLNWWFDLWIMRILLPVNVLVFCGIMAQAFLKPEGLQKHLLTVLIGLICGVIAVFLVYCPRNSRAFRTICNASVAACVVFMIYGQFFKVNGSGISFLGLQPGELCKLLLLMLCIWGFECLRTESACRWAYFRSAAAMFLYLLLVNDLGNSLIIAALILIVLCALGRGKLTAILTALGGAAAIGGSFLLIRLVPSNRLTQRITQSFFYPVTHWADSSVNQNLRQSILSIVRGGLLGTGVYSSDPLYASTTYASYTDFTFACGTSIFGIGFAAVILAALAVLVLHVSPTKEQTQAAYNQLYQGCILSCLFLVQGFVHILGSLSAIPMTGVVLPFVSAGGTAMVTSFAAVGCMAGLNLPREKAWGIRQIWARLTAFGGGKEIIP